ncbi:hypothetical protein SLA2020_284350 [Shorea laevis]
MDLDSDPGHHEIDFGPEIDENDHLSHICIGTTYPTRHHKVHPHYGIPLSVHPHSSLCCLLTQNMVNTLHNTHGSKRISPRLTEPRRHSSLFFFTHYGITVTTTTTWKEKA